VQQHTHPLTHPKQHHRQNSTAKSVTLTLASLFAPPLKLIAARVFSATKIGASLPVWAWEKNRTPRPAPPRPHPTPQTPKSAIFLFWNFETKVF